MKATELRNLSVEDLTAKIADESKSLNALKLNHAVSPVENPMVIKTSRRSVARLKTILNELNQA
jgi:large subunit ribosomal protein L29